MQKNKILWGIIVLVVVLGGVWLVVRGGGDDVAPSAEVEAGAQEGEIVVRGEIVCLPYFIEVSGQGCVKGVEGGGKVYALNSMAIDNPENDMEEGTKVTAIGVFEPAVKDKEANVFDYDGVLVVRVLEVR